MARLKYINWLSTSKYSFLLLCFFVTQKMSCQCSSFISTYTITYLFPPNSVTNFTVGNYWQENQYLCGPNTTVYDTTHSVNCSNNSVLINANCTYITNNGACSMISMYYVKSGGTLQILPGTYTVGSYIEYEPGAIIIDQSAGMTQYTCSALTFPTVNCATSIQESKNENISITTYPNPVSSTLHIESEHYFESGAEIEITNTLGETILNQNYKSEIDISFIPDGIYILLLKNSQLQIAKKRLIIIK